MWRVLSSMPPGKKAGLSLAPPLPHYPTSTPTRYGTHGVHHLDSDDSLVYLLRSFYIGDRATSDASRIQ